MLIAAKQHVVVAVVNQANLRSSLNDPLAVADWIARIDDVVLIAAISA